MWQQLKRACDNNAACLHARLQRQTTQIEAQQAENALLRRQLADRDAQVQRLQQELADLRQVP